MIHRTTFDGRSIKYTNLSHQHLSNIYWFNKIIHKSKSELELLMLDCKFDSVILAYRPSCQFPAEIAYLRAHGYLQDDGKIFYEKKEVGHVMNTFN